MSNIKPPKVIKQTSKSEFSKIKKNIFRKSDDKPKKSVSVNEHDKDNDNSIKVKSATTATNAPNVPKEGTSMQENENGKEKDTKISDLLAASYKTNKSDEERNELTERTERTRMTEMAETTKTSKMSSVTPESNYNSETLIGEKSAISTPDTKINSNNKKKSVAFQSDTMLEIIEESSELDVNKSLEKGKGKESEIVMEVLEEIPEENGFEETDSEILRTEKVEKKYLLISARFWIGIISVVSIASILSGKFSKLMKYYFVF